MKKLVMFAMIACVTFVARESVGVDSSDNVVIVLDASGSMAEGIKDASGNSVTKIDAAKSALHQALAQMPSTTRIGLLVFSADNISDPWVYPLGPRDDAKLKEAIDKPNPGDGTPLGENIKAGADRLLEEREKHHNYGTYRLLIVTDGNTTTSEPMMVRYTKDVMSRGVRVDVIGVGMQEKHVLATKVHTYRAANDPSALSKALREVLAEVSSKSNVPEDEVFASIAPLPVEMSTKIIETLASSGNHPIGTTPQVTVDNNGKSTVTGSVPTPAPASESHAGVIWLVVIACVVFIVFLFWVISNSGY